MTSQISKPFPDDRLNRQDYANGLIKFIKRLDSGVIAIDGEWGVGKSWLGDRLKQGIDQEGIASTIWIDAFEADWEDDPALSLVAAIANQVGSVNKASWLKKAAPCLARLIPAGAKAVAKAAANAAGFNDEIVDDLSDAIKDESSAYIESRLKDLADRKQALMHLKNLLAEVVGQSTNKKLVVFVDELDRCSPEYAIRFLERLKHLFNIEHVIYILLWNRTQIQAAVETFYGVGSGGQMYLDKFIDFPLHLPLSHISKGTIGPMRSLLESLSGRFNRDERLALDENIYWLDAIATLLSLTARESEHLARWWVMSPNRNTVGLETWLLGFKVKHPNLFADIRDGKEDVHVKVRDILNALSPDDNLKAVVETLVNVHSCYMLNDFDHLDAGTVQFLGGRFAHPRDALPAAIRRLETFY